MIPSSNEDRRDYFRIHDQVGLEVKCLANPDDWQREDPFGDDYLEPLQKELRRVDLDIRNQLASLAERDRLLANLMKSLNTKVDTLARIMAFEQNPLQPDHWTEVTLSEGGVAFHDATLNLKPGDYVAIQLTLPPELYRPRAAATVVSISNDDDSRCWVHTEFTMLDDADRQQIARHVMRWQIRQRQREQDSASPS